MKFSTLTRPGSSSISLNCPVQSTTSLLSCSAPPHDCTLTTPTTRVPLSRAQSCYSKQHYIDQLRGPRLIEKRHRAPSQLGGQCISLQLALMELEKHDKESRDHCSKMLDLMKAEAEANRAASNGMALRHIPLRRVHRRKPSPLGLHKKLTTREPLIEHSAPAHTARPARCL